MLTIQVFDRGVLLWESNEDVEFVDCALIFSAAKRCRFIGEKLPNDAAPSSKVIFDSEKQLLAVRDSGFTI